MSRGLATPDPIGRGLAVNEVGAILGSTQRDPAPLYSIGWVRGGRCFESTAVPALRKQAAGLAEHFNRLVGDVENSPDGSTRPARPGAMPARSVA